MQRTLSLLIVTPPRPAQWWRAAVWTVALWHHRAKSRRVLATLTARELADVGLSRADQWRECSKRFWQA
jgi:uncharacterized protein YjiS (DUF1127 family)